jgi:putative transposon-encoded protein
MYAVEFQASVVDGMVQIPKEYQGIASNSRVKVIMMYDENDDLELKTKQKMITKQVKNYYNGTATLLNQEESKLTMDKFMKDLKSKYANS